MKFKHFIYKIVNNINDKIYVGATKNLKGRWSHHKASSRNLKNTEPIYNAMRKYGVENFKMIQIDQTISFQKRERLERKWIKNLKSLVTQNGYNIQLGGSTLGQERVITSQNPKKFNQFGFLGVAKRHKGFNAIIHKFNKSYESKRFSTPKEAAVMYDLMAIKLYGETCVLNFPKNREKYIKNEIKEPESSKEKSQTSKYRGVFFDTRRQKWTSRLQINKKTIYIGYFIDETDAAIAYNIEAWWKLGKMAKLNVISL